MSDADGGTHPDSDDDDADDDDEFYWDDRAKEDDNYLGEDVFKVEAIRRRRVNDGVAEYLIKWEGWARCACAGMPSERAAF